MLGYAILLISFPLIMSQWQVPNSLIENNIEWLDQIKIIMNSSLLSKETIDAMSSATPLASH